MVWALTRSRLDPEKGASPHPSRLRTRPTLTNLVRGLTFSSNTPQTPDLGHPPKKRLDPNIRVNIRKRGLPLALLSARCDHPLSRAPTMWAISTSEALKKMKIQRSQGSATVLDSQVVIGLPHMWMKSTPEIRHKWVNRRTTELHLWDRYSLKNSVRQESKTRRSLKLPEVVSNNGASWVTTKVNFKSSKTPSLHEPSSIASKTRE